MTIGDSDDGESAIRIALAKKGELNRIASQVALKLLPGNDGSVVRLLKASDSMTVGLAIVSLLASEVAVPLPLIEPLLGNVDSEIRIKALSYLIKTLNSEELEELLVEYANKPLHYYNVVVWLDRILYAPPPLKQTFLADLESV
jgi:hypothetical protein